MTFYDRKTVSYKPIVVIQVELKCNNVFNYRKISNIRRTLADNFFFTQMQLEQHLSVLLQPHLHSWLNTWLQKIVQW